LTKDEAVPPFSKGGLGGIWCNVHTSQKLKNISKACLSLIFSVIFPQYSASGIIEDIFSEGCMHVQSDDEIIVTRCLEGDQAAFAFLVEKYKGAVHAYVYHRILDYQEAQDIVQEVFIKAYRKLAQLKWPHRFQSWLYTIASNECSTWLREQLKAREQEVPLEDVPEEDLNELAVRNHSDEDIELTVKSAMETLPHDSQLALSLYYMSDLSTREVAGFMGISPNNAGVKLHRARKQLGERLEKMIGRKLKKEKLRSGFTFTVMNSIRGMPIPSLPKARPIRWAPIPISIGIALLIGIIGYGVSSGKDVSPDMPVLKPAEATFEVSLLPDPDRQTILDTEPENISNLVAADAGDPEQTQPTTETESSGIVVRQIPNIGADASSRVSPDGQYISGVNWANKGNLAIRDFETGENRDVTDEGYEGKDEQFAANSVWSPDSEQLAYLWFRGGYRDLCIVGIDGSESRVLYSNPPATGMLTPREWSRDGKHILALSHYKPGKTVEIVLVSVADGSMRVLKSLDTNCWQGMSLSPDGRYVVYDFHSPNPPQSEDSRNHDIGLVATDGSHEMTLVEHPADDRYPFWAPDGDRIVFASDRSGSMGIWVLDVADGKPKGSPRLIKQNLNGLVPLGLTQDGSYYYGLLSPNVDVYLATLDPETGRVVTPPVKAVQSFEGRNSRPAFSPDGKYLAYISQRPRAWDRGGFKILVIRSLETGEERVLSPEHIAIGDYPCWSPDGRSILTVALGRTDGLDAYQIDTETGAATPVVLRNEQGNISGASLVWSPDGSKIFFMRERSGTRVIRIYDFETEREWGPDFHLAFGEDYTSGLALSPDGQQLAFVVRGDNGLSLQIAPSSGGDTREVLRLTREEGTAWGGGLTWTPDGRHLVFPGKRKDDEPGLVELWRILVEGGEPQDLGLTMKYHQQHPSFHPDGRRIAFTGPGSGHSGVWVMENFLPESIASR
jgi:RNA polymerase sigma factor (sigma-70 family)